jgi:hypothetical protein
MSFGLSEPGGDGNAIVRDLSDREKAPTVKQLARGMYFDLHGAHGSDTASRSGARHGIRFSGFVGDPGGGRKFLELEIIDAASVSSTNQIIILRQLEEL